MRHLCMEGNATSGHFSLHIADGAAKEKRIVPYYLLEDPRHVFYLWFLCPFYLHTLIYLVHFISTEMIPRR